MPRKIILLLSLAILVFGAGLLTTTAVHALYYAPEKEMVLPEPSFFLESSSTPVSISIPSAEIDANVVPVGLTYAGNMSTPKKIYDTGWYKYGTLPGEKGSAVIAGHVDNGFGLAGVFAKLKEVEAGDDIFIRTESGETLRFTVFDVQTYFYTEVPRDILFNRNDGAYLNLVTCDGEWIPEKQTSDHRIVVYAKLSSGQ